MTELLQAYESVVLRPAHYCVICLRTASERRLLKPITLNKLLACVDNPKFKLINKYQMICYICDRQCSVAYRFHNALCLTDKLHHLFEDMNNDKVLRHEIYAHLRKQPVVKKRPVCKNPHELEKWGSRLLSLRMHSMLLQTEVLLLNTELQPPSAPLPPASAPAPAPAGAHVASGAAQGPVVTLTSHEQNVLAEPEIYMDSVVILDEDDPIELPKVERPDSPLVIPDSPPSNIPDMEILPDLPSKTTPKIRPFNNYTQNTPYKVTVPTSTLNLQNLQNEPIILYAQNGAQIQNPQNLLKNALLQNSSLNLQNSSLNLQNSSLNNNLLNIQNVIQAVPAVQNISDKTKYVLQPILETDGLVSVPSLTAQIINGQLVIVNNPNVTIPAPTVVQNGANLKLVSATNQILNPVLNSFNKKDNQIQIVSEYTPVADIKSKMKEKMEERIEAKRRKQEETVGRRETDWEDKIPMDVISFMDATDPNADKILRSSGPVKPLIHGLGVISDVRSISDDPSSTNQNMGSSGQNMGTSGQNTGSSGQNMGSSGQNMGSSGQNTGSSTPIRVTAGQSRITGQISGQTANITSLNMGKVPRVVLPKLSLNNLPTTVKVGPDRVRQSESGRNVYSWGKSVHLVKK